MSTNRISKEPTDNATATALAASSRVMRMVAVTNIDPDTNNRAIDEHDEAFSMLVDSVRVLGVLDPIQVRTHGDRYQLIDGERRWRAALAVGLAEVPCYVWPASAPARETLVAGVVLNEQRQAHRCIHVARRLREIKNTNGLTGEQLAALTGLTIDRVKTYLCLFNGSEFLLDFFARHDVPLAIAAELIRYERATNEARARAVAVKHLQTPLTREDLIRLRKKASERDATDSSAEGARARSGTLSRSVQRAWTRDPIARARSSRPCSTTWASGSWRSSPSTVSWMNQLSSEQVGSRTRRTGRRERGRSLRRQPFRRLCRRRASTKSPPSERPTCPCPPNRRWATTPPTTLPQRRDGGRGCRGQGQVSGGSHEESGTGG